VHELEKKQGIFEGIWSRMRPAGEMRFRLKYEFPTLESINPWF
jgi:hypothetical protein